MTKQIKEALKTLPYYKSIPRKYRYTNPVKDKAWTLLSDYTRMRDFIKFGTCIATGKRITNWRDMDAGHYESMSGHGSLVGFSELNIHAQSPMSNKIGGMADGARYKENLIKRYGKKILKDIETLKRGTIKADDWFFISRIQHIWEWFQTLKKDHKNFDFPEYLK